MHTITPFDRWHTDYDPATDKKSPFYGKQYNYDLYSDTIYGYYIDPAWDFIGSETLYVKLLFVDYARNYAIIELIGEWNDAIENDIMHFKNNVINVLVKNKIQNFILLGANILNFHGSDDCYYEEWFEDAEDGWICAINFQTFVYQEWRKYNIDAYLNYGGELEIDNWRTMKAPHFYEKVREIMQKRLF